MRVKLKTRPAWQAIIKRLLDVLLALLVLGLFGWVYLLTAGLVKASSPGPVLYQQQRVGKGGRPFWIYKFRSMYQYAEPHEPLLSFHADPRVTPWGRIMRRVRLDELPQFYNVLIGDMSVVGPRPERPYFIEQIMRVAPHYQQLLQVRPGITSLGLVKFGYAQNVPEMVQRMHYDLHYLANWSLALDLRVLLSTIKVIWEGRGK